MGVTLSSMLLYFMVLTGLATAPSGSIYRNRGIWVRCTNGKSGAFALANVVNAKPGAFTAARRSYDLWRFYGIFNRYSMLALHSERAHHWVAIFSFGTLSLLRMNSSQDFDG